MRLNPRKTYLSKNPFFSGSSESLITLFKAPKFIYMDRDINQVAPSFFSLKKFLSLVFYGNQPSKIRYKSILKTLLFWREAPTKEDYKSETLNADFKELTSDPIRLINKIYRFMDLVQSIEYKEHMKRETQKVKNYKSNHKYAAAEFDDIMEFKGYDYLSYNCPQSKGKIGFTVTESGGEIVNFHKPTEE